PGALVPALAFAAVERAGARLRPRELPGDAAAAGSALQRELHRFALQPFQRGAVAGHRHAVEAQPLVDRGKVVFLRERIERDPDAEALGQRYLFLDRFPRMHFLADMPRLEILAEIFGQQMPPV